MAESGLQSISLVVTSEITYCSDNVCAPEYTVNSDICNIGHKVSNIGRCHPECKLTTRGTAQYYRGGSQHL